MAHKIIFLLIAGGCLLPFMSAPYALLAGIVVAQLIGNPFQQYNSKATSYLLKASVVGLGFGMHLDSALAAGKDGFLFTVATIIGTLALGMLLAKLLRVDTKPGYLISCGTAICGGSAIAAVSPVVKANEQEMTIALGTVFILNSIALFIFPVIGHLLEMTQHQFGLWSAIAIHDTSSVVGAASSYGDEALQVATTVKLGRALWIIPLSLATAFAFKGENKKIKIPWFIGYFIIAMLIATFLPEAEDIYKNIVMVSKKGLILTLFLIGSGLTFSVLKNVGIRPLIQGILLWIAIGGMALLGVTFIYNG